MTADFLKIEAVKVALTLGHAARHLTVTASLRGGLRSLCGFGANDVIESGGEFTVVEERVTCEACRRAIPKVKK